MLQRASRNLLVLSLELMFRFFNFYPMEAHVMLITQRNI